MTHDIFAKSTVVLWLQFIFKRRHPEYFSKLIEKVVWEINGGSYPGARLCHENEGTIFIFIRTLKSMGILCVLPEKL